MKNSVAHNNAMKILLRVPHFLSATNANHMLANMHMSASQAVMRHLMYKCMCRQDRSENVNISVIS